MRAICEACERPQPVDWKAGDLCVSCGQAVRRDVRCFWCAKWTPAAKFCRHCGAVTVELALYGAARMLKDAGTDRFTIPKQLVEFEPDQIENFTRIFQTHAVVAAQHVSHVDFLETFLHQRPWSSALDDKLATELPWNEERLEEMRTSARKIAAHVDGLARVQAISGHTPFPATRALASLARVVLEDWTALDSAVELLHSADAAMRNEAALAVSHWRVLYGPGLPKAGQTILETLRGCSIAGPAAVRLALLGEPGGAPLPADDFGATLASGDIARLATAAREGDPLERYAAACRLIALGYPAAVAHVLPSASPERQVDLLQLLLRRKKPVPELREVLFEIAMACGGGKVLRLACDLLCIGCDPSQAMRIARLGRQDSSVYQSLLQRAELPPYALNQLGEYLLEAGDFRGGQWGMADIAKQERMPANFVPEHWAQANSVARIELCRFAELQLKEYGDEGLHRFLACAALTPDDVEVQSEAWSCLYRWYDSFGYPRRRPLKISPEAIGFFYASTREFLGAFTRFLSDHRIFGVSLHRDAIADILRYPDAEAFALFVDHPEETDEMIRALAGLMSDAKMDLTIRLACTDCLGYLGAVRDFQAPVDRVLRGFAGTDLELQSKRSLERIRAAGAV